MLVLRSRTLPARCVTRAGRRPDVEIPGVLVFDTRVEQPCRRRNGGRRRARRARDEQVPVWSATMMTSRAARTRYCREHGRPALGPPRNLVSAQPPAPPDRGDSASGAGRACWSRAIRRRGDYHAWAHPLPDGPPRRRRSQFDQPGDPARARPSSPRTRHHAQQSIPTLSPPSRARGPVPPPRTGSAAAAACSLPGERCWSPEVPSGRDALFTARACGDAGRGRAERGEFRFGVEPQARPLRKLFGQARRCGPPCSLARHTGS